MMNFIDALQENAAKLAKKANELCSRIGVLQATGHTADATIAELIKTNAEIGRLNDMIAKELEAAEVRARERNRADI